MIRPHALVSLAFAASLAACAGGSSGSAAAGSGGTTPVIVVTPAPSPAAGNAPGGGSAATPAPVTTPTPAPPAGGATPTQTPVPLRSPSGSATYSDANGSFSYVYFVPTGRTGPYPLVLALHGCLQHTADFEDGTRFFEDAQANGYAVVMPQHLVTPAVNPNGCWQFWSDHYRGKGEPEVLTGIVHDMATRIAVDTHRTYVAGLSSGGAMAVALGAAYPDVFAAIAVGSGTEYQPCISDNVYQCYLALTNQAFDQDGTSSGKAAYTQAKLAGVTRAVPAIYFQGDADTVVSPFNLGLALTSIATMNDGITSNGAYPGVYTANPATHDSGAVPGGYAYDHYTANGGVLDWTVIHGMNHAWAGGVAEPASNASDGNNYFDPKGPNATVASRTFLFRWTLP